MITTGIREFMSRDWTAVRAVKDTYWHERVARLGPLEGWRIGDELRRQVLALHPSWPSEEDRQPDVDAHARLSEMMRRADSARRA